MKISLTALLAVYTMASTFSTFAAEKIEGGFGKKLGEVFDPSSALSTNKLKDGTLMYEFATTNVVRSFNRHYVMITPTTHKIYCIYGVGSVESTSAGRKEQSVIMGILREKYGSEFKIGPVDSMGDIKRISQGTRHIITTLSGHPDNTIDIKCYDDDLEKLAEKEQVAKEAANLDKSAL